MNAEELDSPTPKQLTVDSITNWQLPLLAVLLVTVVFVAIKTVVYRHQARTAYMELQKLEKARDKLAAQWSRLKLEQGTALNQVKVEQYARWDLNMKIPKASEVRMIRQPYEFNLVDGIVHETRQGRNSLKNSSKSPQESSKVVLGD